MAKAKQTDKTNKAPKRDADMPEGFEPLTMTRVDGWFAREAGNSVRGFIKDVFETKSKGKFGPRKVYKIEVTEGETKVLTGDGEEMTVGEGSLVGLDETGYLKKLSDVEKGCEVFILCKGKESDDREAPWIFKIGVMPLPF